MAKNPGAAAATAEARIPDPPRYLIFRLQPEPGRRLNRHAQTSALAKVLALARQAPVAATLPVRTLRALLLLAALAFFVA